MTLLIRNQKAALDAPLEQVYRQALASAGLPPSLAQGCSVARRSVDARHGQIGFVYTVAVQGDFSPALVQKLVEGGRAALPPQQEPMRILPGDTPLEGRPVVVGMGPAGLFAGLLLARMGYHPLLLERGGPVPQRVQQVERFWRAGVLDPACNVQFGEGGAGTFSDGKLTTRIGDPRCTFVLHQLAEYGAPEDILWLPKPHIGTDRLRQVVQNLRRAIEQAGGEVRFHARVDGFETEGGRLCALRVNGERLPCRAAVVAVGHSARDTFAQLAAGGVPLAAKAFAVGVRIEHLQRTIDEGLYRQWAGHPALPPGEYQLSCQVQGRGVYTFCMCPGGQVVPAASQMGGVVTNGMSEYSRAGRNANSALVVTVGPDDFGPRWQDGVAFQQRLEEAAFAAGGGGYRAPAQRVAQLLGRPADGSPVVEPSYALGIREADLQAVLPGFALSALRAALPVMGGKLPGFAGGNAWLTGVESRTSSPVRMARGEDLCAPGAEGLYPCGEGAGYAGGIMSAAVDGLRVAQALIGRYAPPAWL